MTMPFKKLLVANRGEIACRVLRTAERLGLRTVAVFSDADVGSPHVALADEAVRIGPAAVKESYLNVPALLVALAETGADAVHPGYGLLSENPEFATAVSAAGAVFVGPSPEAMRLVGDKIRARESARAAGLLPPPGSDGPVDPADAERLRAEAERIGFPVLVKAAGGGGGIGMQIARDASELERAAKSCAERSRAAFLDARVYLERYLERPRHIELQVLSDAHGAAVILGERECSVQRRYQKIIEESPSPAAFLAGEAGKARRAELTARALALVAAVGYTGAGTIELVADARGDLYFLEVNARIQVEHPVTELVTGVDIVEEQLVIAAGGHLREALRAITPAGHAVEARLYAENPNMGFLPQPGKLVRFRPPEGMPGVRIDAGYTEGCEITPHYDPLIAKIIAHGATREEAIRRLDAALAATAVELTGPRGPRHTNRDFLRAVLESPEFRAGDYDTSLAERLAKSPKTG
jgi:acetyl-CoA carboxylase biotin carboxylase subunit/3-methylcrotonyl-CoA carboxylase alpha subunit